jgi:H+-transporting ATPase
MAASDPPQERTQEIDEKETDDVGDSPIKHHPDHLETGLTDAEVEEARSRFGYNEVEKKEIWWGWKLAKRYFGIVPIIMFVAAILSISVETTCETPNKFSNLTTCECSENIDLISFILLIFEINLVAIMDFFGERQTGNAMAELKRLAETSTNVKRNGTWKVVPKRELVPDDIVALVLGATLPADGKLLGVGELKLDCASVTGEALPVKKIAGDEVLSGTTVVGGEMEMLVTNTGSRSTMGETMTLVQSVDVKKGALRIMMHNLSLSIAGLAVLFTAAILIVLVVRDEPVAEATKLCFVIIVATLPVAMPVVITTGLAVGAYELTDDEAIVQRLSAIEELAGMDVLCSDKTGTLTIGKMSVAKENTYSELDSGFEVQDVHLYSLLASKRENTDAIDSAICNSFGEELRPNLKAYEEKRFTPFSPESKRASCVVLQVDSGDTLEVTKGASEIVCDLPGIDSEARKKALTEVDSQAARGFKTIAVAVSKDVDKVDAEMTWTLCGLLAIIDPPRHDTKETIEGANDHGVEIKMITGDNIRIAQEVARQLGIGNQIMGASIWLPHSADAIQGANGLGEIAEAANGFASVKPKHKFRIVKALQERKHVVGMTGDGVNDAPALATANIGIAVAGATDAARQASDIVLTRKGLSTIIKAINRSRQIFRRLESYVIYRLASSVLILLFFFISIIGFEFDFPTWTLILLSLVNDFTVLATSKDNARSSVEPLRWNVFRLASVAFVIGGICVLHSILLLHFLTDGVENTGGDSAEWLDSIGFTYIDETCELVAVINLTLGLSIQLNIFSARSPLFFFQFAVENKVVLDGDEKDIERCTFTSTRFTETIVELCVEEEKANVPGQRRKVFTGKTFHVRKITTFWFCSHMSDAPPPPSLALCIPVLIAMVLTSIIAAEWDEDITLGGGDPMKGCGWAAVGGVWLWCIIWFLIIEVFKVAMNLLLQERFDRLFKGDFGDIEDESEKVSKESDRRRKKQQAHAIAAAASTEIEGFESLPTISIPKTLDPELVSVLEALQRHVVSLEHRVKELDGRNVNLEKMVRTIHPRKVRAIGGVDESKEAEGSKT